MRDSCLHNAVKDARKGQQGRASPSLGVSIIFIFHAVFEENWPNVKLEPHLWS